MGVGGGVMMIIMLPTKWTAKNTLSFVIYILYTWNV